MGAFGGRAQHEGKTALIIGNYELEPLGPGEEHLHHTAKVIGPHVPMSQQPLAGHNLLTIVSLPSLPEIDDDKRVRLKFAKHFALLHCIEADTPYYTLGVYDIATERVAAPLSLPTTIGSLAVSRGKIAISYVHHAHRRELASWDHPALEPLRKVSRGGFISRDRDFHFLLQFGPDQATLTDASTFGTRVRSQQ